MNAQLKHDLKLFAVVMTLAFLVSLFANLVIGAELFNWSEPAEHHNACVVVRAGSAGGSGVYVRVSDECSGVLTCQHVVAGNTKAKVTWTDGTEATGDVLTDKTDQDSAFINVGHASIQPLAIATAPPTQGERVEAVGFGGPGGRQIRPHWGTVLGYVGRDIHTTAPVISGDSGGCYLNEKHEVVGLSAYGVNTVAVVQGGGSSWNVFRPSGGPAQPSVSAFAQRVAAKCQSGYG